MRDSQDPVSSPDADDRVGYDPMTDTYHGQHDLEDSDPLCITVVETVSAVTGKEPDELEPLYSVLDADALEALMTTTRDGSVRLSFAYEGCTVVVKSSDEVVVTLEE